MHELFALQEKREARGLTKLRSSEFPKFLTFGFSMILMKKICMYVYVHNQVHHEEVK